MSRQLGLENTTELGYPRTVMKFSERPVDWRTVDLAIRHCRGMRFVENPPLERTPESSIVPIARAPNPDLPFLEMRDWLDKNVAGFALMGIYREQTPDQQGVYGFPIALRFVFQNDDDKFLFALRWT